MTEGQIGSARAAIVTLSVEELEADPHGVFRRYRPVAPIIAMRDAGFIVLRDVDVEQLVRDPRLQAVGTQFVEMRGITEGTLHAGFDQSMLTANGAIHRRRRAPFSRTFAARMITDLRPYIKKVANELIDGWQQEGEVDLVARYAALIPARVISEVLGLPSEDIPHFTKLVYSVSRSLSFTFGPDDVPEMEAASAELQNYVRDLLEVRRREPRADFLSSVLAETDGKGELSPYEIIIQIATLIVGGTDTTRLAMAIQVGLLLQHRAQWDAICRDPTLIPGAVSESLRYEPSVASTARQTIEDIELDGHTLPGGQLVMLSTMSAMRDSAVYAQPDAFDIRRTDHRRPHLIFGGGPHRCLGEALAVAELEEGLAVISARLPRLRLSGDAPPHLAGHAGIRRIGEMRVHWPN
jgi:cytochrome P450 family 103